MLAFCSPKASPAPRWRPVPHARNKASSARLENIGWLQDCSSIISKAVRGFESSFRDQYPFALQQQQKRSYNIMYTCMRDW